MVDFGDIGQDKIIIACVFGGIIFFCGSIMFLFCLRLYAQGSQFKNPVRIDGKIVIVTGCNTGIGKETVLDLAGRGAHIYMACRNSELCEKAREEIMKKTGNTNIFNRELDLASLESIRTFAKRFLEEQNRLDILINNAGVMAISKCYTNDGFEMHIGVNHMGHFLLTNLLLDAVISSAPSRIINVSSISHSFGSINREDLNCEKSYNRWTAYFQSKLANVLFTRELAKRLDGSGVSVYSLHPGIVKTELIRHVVNSCFKRLFSPAFYFLFKTPRSGAQTTIACAVDPALKNVNGKYFSDCKMKKEARAARSDDTAKWLWEESEKWTQLNTMNRRY